MNRHLRHGFSMVELLVAVAILTVVVSGVMESFVVQNRAYTVVDQTTESQQNLRALSHLLERDLRMTGFMVPEGASICAIDETNRPDTLYVTDSEPIDPANQALPNLGLRVTSGYGGNVAEYTLTTQAGSPLVPTTVVDGQAYYDDNGDGVPDTDFRENGGAILVDVSNPARGTACGIVTNVVPGGSVRVDFETRLAPGGGGTLVLVPANRYTVDVDGNLLRNELTIATDVDDLQIALFIDDNRDGDVDANEYEASAAAATTYAAESTDHSELREVRFNLVLRTRSEDMKYSEGMAQALENRAAGALPDGFRRRTVTATVKPRNIGFRGGVRG